MNELNTNIPVPINQPQMPVLKANDELKEVRPAYVWKTGRTIFLSKKETIVADTFLRTRNYAECARALQKEGFNKNWLTCKRWLDKSHVSEYLKEKFEELGVTAGWTEGRWLKVMTDHIQGKERLQGGDLYAMKLIAQVKGFGSEGTNFNNNVQINFVEKAG